MEYHITGYRKNDLVRLDVKINNEMAEPLANIVHRNNAYNVGRALTKRLKELIPRQQFKIPIQAAIGAKVVASESLSGIHAASGGLQRAMFCTTATALFRHDCDGLSRLP